MQLCTFFFFKYWQPRPVTHKLACFKGIALKSGLRIRIRIRIGSGFNRDPDPDPDPGGQKLPTKVEIFFKSSCFEVLDGLD